MKLITDYNDIKIHKIQKVRLYMQGRPLVSLWRRKKRGRSLISSMPGLDLIDKELTSSFIALDCAGWYFANDTRSCIAVELDEISSKLWSDVYYEYDYLTWHPTYLPDWPVLAYYSTYFKYSELDDFLSFCQVWSRFHDLILALDPTKIKFNYLKYQIEEIIQSTIKDRKVRVLDKDSFHLLFTLKK